MGEYSEADWRAFRLTVSHFHAIGGQLRFPVVQHSFMGHVPDVRADIIEEQK